MFDIIELKDKIKKGEIALSYNLEQRILHDEMTEDDYKFVSRTFGFIRSLTKEGREK